MSRANLHSHLPERRPFVNMTSGTPSTLKVSLSPALRPLSTFREYLEGPGLIHGAGLAGMLW